MKIMTEENNLVKVIPKARSREIVVQHLKGEVLIYDLTADKAFCLNETLGKVFDLCNGQTSFDELKRETKLTEEIIYLALDELKKENLLEANQHYESPFAGMSRREVIRKVGFASMLALPVISSMVAPTAIHASSTCDDGFKTCTAPGACCSNNCLVTRFDGLRCCVEGTNAGNANPPNLRVACRFSDGCDRAIEACCSGRVQARYEPGDFCSRFGTDYGCYCY